MNSHGPEWGGLACSFPNISDCCCGDRKNLLSSSSVLGPVVYLPFLVLWLPVSRSCWKCTSETSWITCALLCCLSDTHWAESILPRRKGPMNVKLSEEGIICFLFINMVCIRHLPQYFPLLVCTLSWLTHHPDKESHKSCCPTWKATLSFHFPSLSFMKNLPLCMAVVQLLKALVST